MAQPSPTPARTGLSPLIASPDVAFFVGAGASRTFGYRLMGGADYPQLLQEYRNAIRHPNIADLIGQIESSTPPPTNLEDVFEQIASIAACAPTLRSCPLEDACPAASAAQHAEEAIEPVVGERYGCPSPDARGRALETYRQLLEPFWASAHGGTVPVFTTNYDWVLEYVCYDGHYRLSTGFESTYREWDPGILHQLQPGPDERTIVLMKLHGSSGWQRAKRLEGTEKVVMPAPGAQQFVSEVSSHALVSPVRSKAPEGHLALTYFAYLEESLARANAFVIIGYALNELGVQNALTTGLLRREGPPLRMAIVDIDPDPIVERLMKHCPEGTSQVTAFPHTFGRDLTGDLAAQLHAWSRAHAAEEAPDEAAALTPEDAVSLLDDPLTSQRIGAHWSATESKPPGMFRPTPEGACAEWRATGPGFSSSGYWQIARPIGLGEFTVSVEVCPESVGAGWDPGISVIDDTGEVTVIATRVIPAHIGGNPEPFDAMCLLREGPRGANKQVLHAARLQIGPEHWNRVSLQVSGHRARHIVNDLPSDWHDMMALPSIVRLGPFECHRFARGTGDPARYIFRSFSLRLGL